MGFFLLIPYDISCLCISNRFDLALKVFEIEEVKGGKRDQQFYFKNDLFAVFFFPLISYL